MVWLRHTSGHMCVVNSPVLAALGLDAVAAEVPGGRVGTYPDGRPSGLLEERAQTLVGMLVYPFGVAYLADAIDRAGQQYLAEGITSCNEAGIGGGWIGHSPVVVQPRQVAQAAELGVIGVPQGRFASELGDGMLAAVGPERHDWLYRQRSLLEAGMVLPAARTGRS